MVHPKSSNALPANRKHAGRVPDDWALTLEPAPAVDSRHVDRRRHRLVDLFVAVEQQPGRVPAAVDERFARRRRQRHRHPPVAALQLQRLQIDRRRRASGACVTRSWSLRDVSRGAADARHAERHRVAEEDLRERLAHHRPKPRRRIACGACSRDDPQPKLRLTTRISAPVKRGSTIGWLAFWARSWTMSSSKRCVSSPSNDTERRKRAGMMRSVSMLLPPSGSARPWMRVIRSIAIS